MKMWSLWMRWGFPDSSAGEESTCNAGDMGSVPGLGRCPGGGHGNQLQYSCLESPMDRGAWQAIANGITKSWTQLSNFTFIRCHDQLNGHKFEQAPGDGERQGSLACCSPYGHRVEDDWETEPPGKPKSTGVGSLSLLQGIFLTQELNQGLLHCRWILHQLSYQGILASNTHKNKFHREYTPFLIAGEIFFHFFVLVLGYVLPKGNK